jgi:hypothetical protein
VTEPVLTEERMAAELEAYGLRDTADGRTTVREVFAKELAEVRRLSYAPRDSHHLLAGA